MSFYHIMFLVLAFGTVIEYRRQKSSKALFALTFFLLTAMLCFRYGQGTDYYTYSSMYYTMPLDIPGVISYNFAKAEIGWRLIYMLFRRWGFQFSEFVFLLSLVQMLLFYRFISRYCRSKVLALFLSYHTLYLTYFSSALRQGLVIAVFLGILLQWLLDGKLIKYCMGVLACSVVHSVSLILLILVVFRLIYLSYSRLVSLVLVGMALGCIFSMMNVGQILKHVISLSYLGDTEISVIALLERVLTYIVVAYLYYLYVDGREPSQKDQLFMLFKIYSLGMTLYGLLMWSPLISSRTIFVLKSIEIALISTLIVKAGKSRLIVLAYCLLLCSAMYVKNIGSYISQGEYQNTSIASFPYVSVFDKGEIGVYRGDTAEYINWLEIDIQPVQTP